MSDDVKARRLLAHIFAPQTRWSRLSGRLLDFGVRDSRNPVRWLAAEVGAWMGDMRTQRINRRFNKSERNRR